MSDLLKCSTAQSGAIVSPRGRMWFCAVAKKFKSKKKTDKRPNDEGAYIVTLVIPPNADMSVMIDAVKSKAKEKWPNLPGNLKWPIRKCKEVFTEDGDPKYPAEMAEFFQITANTFQQQPGVVDAKGVVLNKLLPGESTDDLNKRVEDNCYSGRWARISVAPSNFDQDGSKGVKLYLQNVQVLDHDEQIGRRGGKAEDDFAPVDGAGPAAAAGGEAAGTSDSIFG